jgi:hypothetical protein
VVSYHVVKGVLPAEQLKGGMVLKTMAGGATFKVVREPGAEDIELQSSMWDLDEEGNTDHEHTDYLALPDLTFEAPYDPKTSKYVMHVIDRVLMPKVAVPALRQLYLGNTE